MKWRTSRAVGSDFAGKEKEGSNERDERKRKRGEEKKPASAKLQEGSTREGSLNSNDIWTALLLADCTGCGGAWHKAIISKWGGLLSSVHWTLYTGNYKSKGCLVLVGEGERSTKRIDWSIHKWIHISRSMRSTNLRNKGLISADRRASLLSCLQYPVPYLSRLQRIYLSQCLKL